MADNKEIFVFTKMSEFTPSNDLNKQTDIIALQDGKNVRIDSEVISQQVINKVNPKFIERKEKGQPNGVATLDENGKVPSTQLPPLDFTVNETPIDKQTPTPTQNGVFLPTQIGTYPNFGGLEYTQQEFDNNDDVRFIFIDGRFEKQVKPFGLEGEINSADTRAVGGDKVYDYTLKEVKTIAELRTVVGEEEQTVRLLGYYEAGDKPPLLYKWISGVGEDDGGSVVVVGSGYWKALFEARGYACTEDFGAKGDVTRDDSDSFIKALKSYRKVLLFNKNYLITKTIRVEKNTTIEGLAVSNTMHTMALTKITFNPSSNIPLFESGEKQGNGYLSGISISKLTIKGNNKAKNALLLKSVANSRFEYIYTDTFDDACVIDTSMNVDFNMCNFAENRNSCVKFIGGVSTTTVFDKCYLHFSAWGFIAEHNTCLGIIFNNSILESCTEGGADIYTDNVIDFVNLYTENIPRSKMANVPTIKIGVNGIEKNVGYPTGKVNFVGGNIAGCNFGIDSNSLLIEVDKVSLVSFYGISCNRSAYLISTTKDTKLVTFDSLSVFEISSLYGKIHSRKQTSFNRINSVNTVSNKIETTRLSLLGKSNWSIADEYLFDESELIIRRDDIVTLLINNKSTLSLGESKNTTGSITNALRLLVSNENFTSTTYSGSSYIYSGKDSNGMIRVKATQSDGAKGFLQVNQALTTQNRPIYAYIGQSIFDTTLNKPIYWNGAKWVDSQGADV